MPNPDTPDNLIATETKEAPFQYSLDLQAPQTEEVDRFEGIFVDDLLETEKRTVVRLALEVLKRKHRRGEPLSSPERTKEYLRLQLAERRNEVFGALFVDNRHRVICLEELFYGTVDGASVHPRVVVQRALALNAVAVIFVHNHPSGIAEPSQADLKITQRLKDSLNLVDVRVLDHIIVGVEETVSLAERSLL